MQNDLQHGERIQPTRLSWFGVLFQWFGVVGSTITLVSSLQGAIEFSGWPQRIVEKWAAIAKSIWQEVISIPLPDFNLSQVEALLFTLVYFMEMIRYRSSSSARSFHVKPILWAGFGALVFCVIFARGWLVTIMSYRAESDKVMQRLIDKEDFNIFESLDFVGEHFGEVGSIGQALSEIASRYTTYSPEIGFALLSFFVFIFILSGFALAECVLAIVGRSVNADQLNKNVWRINASVLLVLAANYLMRYFS